MSTTSDGSFSLQLVVTQSTIQAEADKHFEIFKSKFHTDGFRPGKVPPDIIKKHYPENEAIETIFSPLVSRLYSEKIKELGYHPIIPPHVEILNKPLTLDKDWELKLTTCELPKIKLPQDLKERIKKLNSQRKKTDDKNTHLNQIIETIIKSSQFQLPQILLDHEMEHHLSRLIDQVSQAGLTVNQYLASKKTTLENYRQSLQKQIWQDWCLNLAVRTIADQEHLHPTPKDIDTLISKTPHLSDNRPLAQYILAQEKVFNWLTSL